MPSNFLPEDDAALATWLANFKTVAQANAETCQLEPGDTQTIADDTAAYTTALAAVEPAKQVLKNRVATKNDKKSDAKTMARTYARKIKGIPGIDPGLLAQLGIVSNTVSTPLTPPTGLTVVGCSDGINKLKWSRGSNSASASFIVEYRPASSAIWSFLGVVGKTKFDHEDQEPGEMLWYRVTATRAGQNSAPCPAVAVYGPGGIGELKAAA